MQRKIISFLIVSVLSGCVPTGHPASGNLSAVPLASGNGWDTLKILSASECGAGPSPPKREMAVEMSNCVTGLVKEYVLPEAAFPELLLASRKEALRIAKRYAAGRLTPEEYKKQSEARLRSYRDSLIYLIHQRPSHAG